MHGTLVIFRKELKEILRDRRTLIFMLAFPLLIIPLLLEGAAYFTLEAERKAATETLRYELVAGERLPGLAEAFAGSTGFERVELPGLADADRSDGDTAARLKAAVNGGELDFALVVAAPTPAPDRAGPAGVQTRVTLYYDNASSSDKAEERATVVLQRFGDSLRAERLAGLGVDTAAQPRLLEPVRVDARGSADMRAFVGEIIGRILPYFFIIFCYLGALYPAVDLGAGEKERGTLETLLLVPLGRHSIVLGKFLVVFLAGATSAVVSLLSLGSWAAYRASSMGGKLGDLMEVLGAIGGLDLVLIAGMLVPAAAMFAAVLLSISIYARSFKEAQSYAVPFNFLVIMPAMLSMLPGVELTWGWAMVPITNIALAVKELVKGTMDYVMLVAILGSSAALAGVLLGFCTWWFRREQVLFRT
ncbi:ABC transporter permease subunit [Haliangium sp.]|uniref:ABC transporter permease subunit n=1 Tax=Haliangium sp. TaxID=2663208 RepID=UPI003D0C4A67